MSANGFRTADRPKVRRLKQARQLGEHVAIASRLSEYFDHLFPCSDRRFLAASKRSAFSAPPWAKAVARSFLGNASGRLRSKCAARERNNQRLRQRAALATGVASPSVRCTQARQLRAWDSIFKFGMGPPSPLPFNTFYLFMLSRSHQ
jgi:hypothetical protein